MIEGWNKIIISLFKLNGSILYRLVHVIGGSFLREERDEFQEKRWEQSHVGQV